MIITTNRLILRPFKKSDYMDLYEYLKNPEVNCFSSMKLNNLKEAKKEAKRRIKIDNYFAITLKDTNKVIGEIEASFITVDPTNKIKDTVSPCFMLNKKYQGKGYAYEAMYAFYDYLFNTLNVRRIYTYTEDYNKSCQNLCLKLGMRLEGKFLEFVCFVDDQKGNKIYENTWQYAILKKEWNR